MVKNDEYRRRVIILGAGLSGLKCTQDLVLKHGLSTADEVIVLEASERIGGRVKNDTSLVDGLSVDLGAELIHGDETSLFRLAEKLNWEKEERVTLAPGDGGPGRPTSNNGFGLFYVGRDKRMIGMNSKDSGYMHLMTCFDSMATLGDLFDRHDSLEESCSSSDSIHHSRSSTSLLPHEFSMKEGLSAAGVDEPMLALAEAGYANTMGAALDDINLRGVCCYVREWDVDGDRTFVLQNSFGCVVKEMSRGIESCIRTKWPAAKVEYGTPGRVKVTSTDGRVEIGTHVVSTLPLSVLADGDVEFSPNLPEVKRHALQKMGMGRLVKIILKFDRQVLPPLLHGCICSDSFIPEFWFRHYPNTPRGGYTLLAVAFVGGPLADAVSLLQPEEALQKALQQLDDMFGGRKWLGGGGCTGKGDWDDHSRFGGDYVRGDEDIQGGSEQRVQASEFLTTKHNTLPSQSYVDGVVQDWTAEPYIRGGYGYPKQGFDKNTCAELAAAVEGRLFFAGEHTNVPLGMTTHAAIDSGERCALEVLNATTRSKQRATLQQQAAQ